MIHLVPRYKRRALCGEPKPVSRNGWTRNVEETDCSSCFAIRTFHDGKGFLATAHAMNDRFRPSFVWTAAEVEEIVRGLRPPTGAARSPCRPRTSP